MLVYLLLTFITVFLGMLVVSPFSENYPTSEKTAFRNHVCLIGIFFLLWYVSAFRIGIGNDYYKYVEFINRITFRSYVPTEPGFNALVRFCNLLFGNENYFAIFAMIGGITIFIFLWTIYAESPDFSLSFFLFMALGIYFQTLNTIRYYLALSLVLFALKQLNRPQPDYFSFLLITLFSSLFHKSALIAIPFYLLIAKITQLSLPAAKTSSYFSHPLKHQPAEIASSQNPNQKSSAWKNLLLYPYFSGFICVTSLLSLLICVSSFYLRD
ncbi:MAG: EpsG family protein, partial [Lachnospiraceae bacterium]|nr:EpsG family protein [Lachnospiraceae bacterium]